MFKRVKDKDKDKEEKKEKKEKKGKEKKKKYDSNSTEIDFKQEGRESIKEGTLCKLLHSKKKGKGIICNLLLKKSQVQKCREA